MQVDPECEKALKEFLIKKMAVGEKPTAKKIRFKAYYGSKWNTYEMWDISSYWGI